MKKLLPTILLLIPVLITSCIPTNETKDYAQHVNPFIGTAKNGHTFPGACRPFGMIQCSPVTGATGWEYCTEYQYTDSILWGFTQTHLNGTGCTDLGDILVMPFTGERTRNWDGYRSLIAKETETASPGYYSVQLLPSNIKAELTATPHVAIHRYTFPENDTASLLIDLQHGPSWNERQYHSQVLSCHTQWETPQRLSGHVQNHVWVKQDYFFVMEFSQPVIDSLRLEMSETEKGQRIVASFNTLHEKSLCVKIALSTTSIEGAKKNLQKEFNGWDFDNIRQEARDDWNHYLSRIEVEGTEEEKTNFYTCLYHTLIQPNQISDVDGLYRNAADSIISAQNGVFYSTFSLWDTYRAAHPLYTLLTPEKVDDFVNSLVEQSQVQGFLPIWGLWGKENYCMIGNHGVSVIAEAYKKGFRGFDEEQAYEAIKRTMTQSHKLKSDWETYLQYGYFPADVVQTESVSSTLETTYDDYAASEMARMLGYEEDAAYFKRRANFYKNLFCPTTLFMRPRLADRSWKTPFNPNDVAHAESVGGDYTEGNAWQYTWHVQHDIPGLIALFGGNQTFLEKLDSVFTTPLLTSQSDVTGLIGQYAHGNEPSHHITYLYTLAGKPHRTQELIHTIFDTQYHPRPDGLCGNDDCGQMSAWYIFSAMGFYPVDPVSGEYVFGAPQFPQFTLHLPNGKTFRIHAQNLSKANKYVKRIILNGKPYTHPSISHKDIIKGGELIFEMGAE